MPEYLVRVKGKLQLPEKSSSGSRQPNSKKIQENLSIHRLLEFRYPLKTKIGGFNPANPAQFRKICPYLHTGVGHRELDEEIELFLSVEPFLFAAALEQVTIGAFAVDDAIMRRFYGDLFPQFSE